MQFKFPRANSHCYRYINGILILVAVFFITEADSAFTLGKYSKQFQTISVNDSRPVAKAIEILERRYSFVITYEDPPYIYANDVIDETDPAYKRDNPNGFRALTPKRGILELSYTESSKNIKSEDIRKLIQKILDIHAERGNPGRFRLQQEGSLFHIIPTEVRDISGKLISKRAILDSVISLPEQERSIYETLKLLTKTISQTQGVKVIIGAIPLSLLINTSSRQGFTNESARAVLVRTLASAGSKLSWQMFYDPGMKLYVLNIHGVRN